jgi:hypothetical protein
VKKQATIYWHCKTWSHCSDKKFNGFAIRRGFRYKAQGEDKFSLIVFALRPEP